MAPGAGGRLSSDGVPGASPAGAAAGASDGLLLTLMLFLVALFAALVATARPPVPEAPTLPPALSALAPLGPARPDGIHLKSALFVPDSAALTDAGVAALSPLVAATYRLRPGERLLLDIVPASTDADLVAARLAVLATALTAHGLDLADVRLGSAPGGGAMVRLSGAPS